MERKMAQNNQKNTEGKQSWTADTTQLQDYY